LAETFYFLPQKGTTVTIDLGCHARDHLQEVPHLHLQDIGLQPNGFRRFRLHL
jgi:hypothetical protein